jgi:outer membrane protein TolC
VALGLLPWPCIGCSQLGPTSDLALVQPTTVRAAAPEAPKPVASSPQTAAPVTPTQLPPVVAAEAHAKTLPIDLDTVFRLGEGQNAQIALARAKVEEAYAQKDVAGTRWLPDTHIGSAYYRHEGGIQNEDGTLTHSSFGALFEGMEINSILDVRKIAFEQINADRMVWQQKGELSRITNETLLEATETYVDLVAATEGRALARRLELDVEGLLMRARDLYKVEKSESVRMEVTRLEAELAARRQAQFKLREQSAAASAKLVYLLGLEPCTELIPIDARLIRLELVDATPPCCDLVSQALANGPGIREIEGLLAVINQGIERSKGPGKFLPVFEVHMAEGAFGAGPGDSIAWDNRWDLGVQARWNLTDLVTARDRERVAQAKLQQVHLTYDDLRAKLAAGVQAARESIRNGDEEIRLDDEQVGKAEDTYKISDERLRARIQGSSYGEVLFGLQGRALAQLNRLQDVRSYDKAQLRLLLLLGPAPHQNPECQPAPPR